MKSFTTAIAVLMCATFTVANDSADRSDNAYIAALEAIRSPSRGIVQLGGVQCAAGSRSASGIEPCTPCDAGKISTMVGSKTCTPCTIGHDSILGSRACSPCIAGTSNSVAGGICTPCKAGTYAISIASSVCTPCAAGTFSSAGSVLCQAVAVGSYSDGTVAAKGCTLSAGAATCDPTTGNEATCKIGYGLALADRATVKTCIVCPNGSINTPGSTTTCSPCPAGFYVEHDSGPHDSCLACPRGTFSVVPGSLGVSLNGGTDIPFPDYYTNNSPVCLSCPQGTFASEVGSAACVAVPARHCQKNIGSSGFTLCPGGSFCNPQTCIPY